MCTNINAIVRYQNVLFESRKDNIFLHNSIFIMHPRIESDRLDDAFSSFLRSSLLSLGIYYEYVSL